MKQMRLFAISASIFLAACGGGGGDEEHTVEVETKPLYLLPIDGRMLVEPQESDSVVEARQGGMHRPQDVPPVPLPHTAPR